MRKLPVILLTFLFLLSLSLASFFGYKLYKTGTLSFLVFDKISVFSEVPGVKAQLNNREDLEKLLSYLDFWEGVTPDNIPTPRNSFKPKKLIIHITDNEYSTTRERDRNREYLFSARGGGGKDGVFHLYLGFAERLFNENVGKFDKLIDATIIKALYERAQDIEGAYGPDAIGLREAKLENEPYIILTKD